ncbi:hypothetical protein PINS_up008671 [Pythium insidiosum]|nr:hypothetical protein PINS_up008671 [Pythium insidiosum]
MRRSPKILLCWALAAVYLLSYMGNSHGAAPSALESLMKKLQAQRVSAKEVTLHFVANARRYNNSARLLTASKKTSPQETTQIVMQKKLNAVFTPEYLVRLDKGEDRRAERNAVSSFWAARDNARYPRRVGYRRLYEIAVYHLGRNSRQPIKSNKEAIAILNLMEGALCWINYDCASVRFDPNNILTESAAKYMQDFLTGSCQLPRLLSALPDAEDPSTALRSDPFDDTASYNDIDDFCGQLVIFVLDIDSDGGNFADYDLTEDDLGMCLWCIDRIIATVSTTSGSKSVAEHGEPTTDKPSQSPRLRESSTEDPSTASPSAPPTGDEKTSLPASSTGRPPAASSLARGTDRQIGALLSFLLATVLFT